MAKKENIPQCDALYLNINNFLEAKKQLKELHIDCTDRKLSHILDCNIRTMQKYRSKKNQFPIPRLRLEKLAQYMDVSPEWLCGYENSISFGGIGWSADKCFLRILNPSPQRELLEKYLELVGIKSLRKDCIPGFSQNFEGKDGVTDINNHPVSMSQYDKYLNEIEAAIEYITNRFIENIVSPDSLIDPEEASNIRFHIFTKN